MSILDKLTKHLESEEGKASMKAYFDKLKRKKDIEKHRIERVAEYMKTHQLEDVVSRLISEHDSAYEDKCYKRGFMPHLNKKFSLFWSYVEKTGTWVDDEDVPDFIGTDFLSSCVIYGDYYWTLFCGQGCFHRLYSKDGEILMQT